MADVNRPVWIIVGATNPDPINDTFDVCYYGEGGWSTDLGLAMIFEQEEVEFVPMPTGGVWLEIGGIIGHG